MSSQILESSSESDFLKEEDLESLVSKRSYDCIFCKRGFGSAQALGGHMNIHRKDRANKAKQNTSVSSSTFINNHYFEPLLVTSQMSYEPSVSNPHGYFHELGDLSINLWGSDLSLSIEPCKEIRSQLWNGDRLDLELRLGYDQ